MTGRIFVSTRVLGFLEEDIEHVFLADAEMLPDLDERFRRGNGRIDDPEVMQRHIGANECRRHQAGKAAQTGGRRADQRRFRASGWWAYTRWCRRATPPSC